MRNDATAGRTIDSYPIKLHAHHMAEIFDVSLKRFYALDAEGAVSYTHLTLPTIYSV